MSCGLSGKSTETIRTVLDVAAALDMYGKNIVVNKWFWADAFLGSINPFSLFAL